jgi:hypothetical protein
MGRQASLIARSSFGVPIFGADLEFSFGGHTRVVDIYGSAGGSFGRTEQGLLVGQARLGPTFLVPVVDRLRLGLEPASVGSGSGQSREMRMLDTYFLGIHGIATVDVKRNEEYAIFLGGRMGGDYLDSEAWLFTATLMRGARY